MLLNDNEKRIYELEQKRQDLVNKHNRLLGRKEALEENLKSVNDDLNNTKNVKNNLDRLVLIFKQISVNFQDDFLVAVSGLVEKGLQSVFGNQTRFRIALGSWGQQITMSLEVSFDAGKRWSQPLDTHGGGVVVLIGLILRIVVVRLLNATQRQIVFLDEPLNHLSVYYRPKAANLLRNLAHDLGIQIVLISHDKEFGEYADKIIEFKELNGGVVAYEI